MASTTTFLLLLPLLLLLTTAPSASAIVFNITRILSQYPDFSTFSSLLNQTGLAPEMNKRRTITVLAVPNSAIGAVASRPLEVAKKILSVHVILDYYDSVKLHRRKTKSVLFTTLYQTTGVADNQAGFVNMTKLPNGRISFGSAVPGAGLTSDFVEEVMTRPYNISILHVTNVIVPPNVDNLKYYPEPIRLPPVAPAPAKETPPEEPIASEPAEGAEAPEADSAEAPEPNSADAPEADAPGADAPEADAPEADAPTEKEEDAPEEEAEDDDKVPAAPEPPSSAGRVVISGGLAVAVASMFFGAI